MKLLLLAEQCNPQFPSWPSVAYNYYHELSTRIDVTLVTHQRNKEALEKVRGGRKIIYISKSMGSAHKTGLSARYLQSAKANSPNQY